MTPKIEIGIKIRLITQPWLQDSPKSHDDVNKSLMLTKPNPFFFFISRNELRCKDVMFLTLYTTALVRGVIPRTAGVIYQLVDSLDLSEPVELATPLLTPAQISC